MDGHWRVCAGGEVYSSDSVVLATDFKQTRTLLAGLPSSPNEPPFPGDGFDQFIPAPITTVHLWYDRDVTQLDHAVLLDTRIQWVFTKSRIRRWPAERGCYLELVISASWAGTTSANSCRPAAVSQSRFAWPSRTRRTCPSRSERRHVPDAEQPSEPQPIFTLTVQPDQIQSYTFDQLDEALRQWQAVTTRAKTDGQIDRG